MGSHQVQRIYNYDFSLFACWLISYMIFMTFCLNIVFLCCPSQGVAVLGIALIAMGEEIGSEMALLTFGHLVSRTIHCQLSTL